MYSQFMYFLYICILYIFAICIIFIIFSCNYNQVKKNLLTLRDAATKTFAHGQRNENCTSVLIE